MNARMSPCCLWPEAPGSWHWCAPTPPGGTAQLRGTNAASRPCRAGSHTGQLITRGSKRCRTVHEKNRSGALSARQLRKDAQQRQPAGFTVDGVALHQPPWAPTATMITASAIAKAGSAWLVSDCKALGRAGESSFQGEPNNQKGSNKFRQMGPRAACQCFARRHYRNEARRESR